jgi:hypothetical protein
MSRRCRRSEFWIGLSFRIDSQGAARRDVKEVQKK